MLNERQLDEVRKMTEHRGDDYTWGSFLRVLGAAGGMLVVLIVLAYLAFKAMS